MGGRASASVALLRTEGEAGRRGGANVFAASGRSAPSDAYAAGAGITEPLSCGNCSVGRTTRRESRGTIAATPAAVNRTRKVRQSQEMEKCTIAPVKPQTMKPTTDQIDRPPIAVLLAKPAPSAAGLDLRPLLQHPPDHPINGSNCEPAGARTYRGGPSGPSARATVRRLIPSRLPISRCDTRSPPKWRTIRFLEVAHYWAPDMGCASRSDWRRSRQDRATRSRDPNCPRGVMAGGPTSPCVPCPAHVKQQRDDATI